MKHDELEMSDPIVNESTRARFKISFGKQNEQHSLKSSSVEKEEVDSSQETAPVDSVEITEIGLTDSAGGKRDDMTPEGSERLNGLAEELRGAAPATGNLVTMDDLWMAFLCSLDRKDPTPELWTKLRSLESPPVELLHRKTSSRIISQYEIVNKSDIGIDQHTLSIPELAVRYDVCLREGVSERASARIIQELSLQPEKHPNQHRVWGNTEKMKREAPWLGAEAIELLAQTVRVLRSGALSQVSAADLVPGDVVFLTSGNEVPADLRVICCADNSTVDISQFSNKYEQRSITSDKMNTCDPFDATNLLFFGTVITSGEVFAIVYRLGRETMLRTMSTAMPVDMRGFTAAIHLRKKEARRTLKGLYDIGFLLKSSPSISALGSTDCVLLCLPSIILGTNQAQTSIVNMVKAGLRVVVVLERASTHDILKNCVHKSKLCSKVKIEEVEASLMKSSAKNFVEQLYDLGQQRGRHVEFIDLEVDSGVEHVCRTVRHYSLALCWERMDRPEASLRLSTLAEKLRDDDEEQNTVLGVFSGRVGHIEAIRMTDIGVVCRAFGQATDAAVRACDGLTWRRKQNNDMSWILPAIHKAQEVHYKASSSSKCCTIL